MKECIIVDEIFCLRSFFFAIYFILLGIECLEHTKILSLLCSGCNYVFYHLTLAASHLKESMLHVMFNQVV